MKEAKRATIAEPLLQWYDEFGRHGLPWQHNRNAYTVWVSEIMLQQTQVATVIPYYQKFLKSFPNVIALANADIDHVLQHWAGLGYYARGRNLHKSAKIVAENHAGEMPTQFDNLLALPGIGRSTAGAIMAQAYKEPYAILDGNVKRVLARLYCVKGWPGNAKVADKLWLHAEANTPDQRIDDYTQAIMDLGATVCKRSKPDCSACPLKQSCQAFKANEVDLYPDKKPKKTLPTKTLQMLMLKHKNKLLLEKRPSSGIWGGLYSLPEIEESESCLKWWKESDYSQLGELEIVATHPHIRHSFSHYHLDIIPVEAKLLGTKAAKGSHVAEQAKSYLLTDSVLWHDIKADELSIGLPAPIKKIVKLYAE